MLSCAQLNKMLYPTTVAPATGTTVLTMEANSLQVPIPKSSSATIETQSEISSADSDWSDIRAIAVKLGVANLEDLHTERFKVDRQKLEQMIKMDSAVEGMNGAEYFFDNVMKTTATHISWPCRLKIGAKSKKDPHVRIVGKVGDVFSAKERILSNLDSRGTRVIMKMDVSYTDHSYIIGRGGNNIKRIMENTSTHIHFPDSNRSNPTEKSNQVSLCGSLEGVERARALVRFSTPLLMSFELPVLAPGLPQPDRDTPYISMVENKYNVQVIFTSRQKLHSSLVLVKGSEKEADKVNEATQLLINYTCEKIASQILVNMQLEISPQHHDIVKGKHNSNLLDIMERTNTKIIFPDLSDINVKPLKKSQVTITGTIEAVYKARQQLLGNLPIALIFDFPDNQNDATTIINLSSKYGVYISLRQKIRQSTLAVVIKGVEKFIDKIYEARHEILSLKTPVMKPEIPESYFSPLDKDFNLNYRTALTSLLAGFPDSPKTPKIQQNHYQVSPYDNLLQMNNNNNNNNNNNMLFNNKNALQTQVLQQSLAGFNGTPPTICPPTQKYLQIHNNNFAQQQTHHNNNKNNNYLQVAPLVLQQQLQQQQQKHNVLQQTQQQQQSQQGHSLQISPRNSSSNNTSGYQSFSSSSTSLEQACPPYVKATTTNAGVVNVNRHVAPGGRTLFSPDSSSFANEILGTRIGRRASDGILLGLNTTANNASVGPGSAESYRALSHYDFRRALGFKAMERPPVSGEMRTPNANWMGMALSRTSPAPLETSDDNSWLSGATGAPISPYNLGITTGVADSTPTNRRLQLSQHKNIHSLLTCLGLEHYIKIFVLNEIDLEIFTTLTEDNLMELGITAFGARKKLLVAIHTLQANEAANSFMPTTPGTTSSPRFSGSAAPGAERRPSNQW